MTAPADTAGLARVGIIMPTYNGARFIGEQLDSLLGQVGVSLHVYAFDDGSSDRTVAILRDYAAAHPDMFSVFENEVNSGGTGLNIFCNIHRVSDNHDFFALADQDDVWLPDKLLRGIEALRRDGTDLYFSNLMVWDGKDAILGLVRRDAPLRVRDHLFGGGSAGCTYVLSARFFLHLKDRLAPIDFNGIKRISHDWTIYFIARHDDFGVSVASDAMIKYRVHSDSQYGAMTLGGAGALLRKFRMLRGGFLMEQVVNALRFARPGTEDERALLAYRRSWLGRLSVLLRHNRSLARETSRFVFLVIATLIFVRK